LTASSAGIVYTSHAHLETLFGWIQRITGVQDAGLVRSAKGLMTHVFGRFTAAMMKIIYPLADF